VDGVGSAALDPPVHRPCYSALGSERAWLMPSLDDAVERYVRARVLL
jgi:dTDP-4-dehydrorhamnose reductase